MSSEKVVKENFGSLNRTKLPNNMKIALPSPER